MFVNKFEDIDNIIFRLKNCLSNVHNFANTKYYSKVLTFL